MRTHTRRRAQRAVSRHRVTWPVPHNHAPLDTTGAKFDANIVTEYLDDSTENPLVKGPSAALGHNSNFKVFSSDNNAIMQDV